MVLTGRQGTDGLPQLAGELLGAAHRGVETGEVPFLDDLEDTRAQRVGEHRRVDASADEDDRKARPVDAHLLGQGEGGAEIDAGAEDDAVLAELHLEVSAQGVQRGQHKGVRAERRVQRLRGAHI